MTNLGWLTLLRVRGTSPPKIKETSKEALKKRSLFHSCGNFNPNLPQKQVKFSKSRFAAELPFAENQRIGALTRFQLLK